MKIKIWLFYLSVIVIAGGCRKNHQDEYLSVLTCDNVLCETIIYDLRTSLHIMENEVLLKMNEKDAIYFCLSTSERCGASIYGSLVKLVKTDLTKYLVIWQRFDLNHANSFIGSIWVSKKIVS